MLAKVGLAQGGELLDKGLRQGPRNQRCVGEFEYRVLLGARVKRGVVAGGAADEQGAAIRTIEPFKSLDFTDLA
ncbi:MAG: hypothetical protein MI724_05370 [Spirochaetales bacterium]|nr:hypothetical protein [Spirochaetales bacterium]